MPSQGERRTSINIPGANRKASPKSATPSAKPGIKIPSRKKFLALANKPSPTVPKKLGGGIPQGRRPRKSRAPLPGTRKPGIQ